MYTYENFDGAFEYACDSVMSRENEQLVLEGIGELLEETQERVDEIMHELEAINKELDMLSARLEDLVQGR